MEKRYKPTELARLLGKKVITVAQRFSSPHAQARWGVVFERREDGTVNRYVPEKNLHLWKREKKYVGRPTKKEALQSARNNVI